MSQTRQAIISGHAPDPVEEPRLPVLFLFLQLLLQPLHHLQAVVQLQAAVFLEEAPLVVVAVEDQVAVETVQV